MEEEQRLKVQESGDLGEFALGQKKGHLFLRGGKKGEVG